MATTPRFRLWVLLLVVALFVALFGWWGNARLQNTLQQTVRAELETMLNANVTALEIWITNQTRLVTVMAAEPQLRELALERFTDMPEGEGQRSRGNQAPFGREPTELDRQLSARLQALRYEGILVSTNMRVAAASGRGRMRLGMPMLEDLHQRLGEMFRSGEPVLITPFRPRMPEWGRRPPESTRRGADRGFQGRPRWRPDTNLTVMLVAAPVRDEQGAVKGGLALVIDPEKEFSRMLSVARFGSSGETYAFDSSGLMISRSRFEEQLKTLGLIESKEGATSALTLPLVDPGGDMLKGFRPSGSLTNRPLTQFVADALMGYEGVQTEPASDYRGVPVVGAWRWLSDQHFGVVTQMDAREAYQGLRVLRGLFLVLFLLLVLSANGFFLASYLGAGWRRRLSEAELKARRLGQYQLEEKIGEGGMGVVYRAHHAMLRRDTAIKLLLPERAHPAAIQRFEKEVRLTCQLTHPNTIQVYDYGHTPEGLFYYAMEYLQGLNLKELVGEYGPQLEGRVVYILGEVADALREAHERGLVHRDIKPANVFLTNRGGVPDGVKVLDFGLVREFREEKREGGDESEDEGVVGTPLFMSPESIRSPGRSDPRTDIYSLGALGYYLITGGPVFAGETVEEVTNQHLHDTPVSPNGRSGVLVSQALEALILGCLEKDPDRRPSSASEFKRSLLTSPHAGDWGGEARAEWWRKHAERSVSGDGAADSATAKAAENLRVDLTVRLP